MIKKITFAVIVILVGIQFVPMKKNESGTNDFDITTNYQVPEHVATLMQGACNDCHTNTTKYPWYSNVQPVGFWLNHHTNEGKEHLNFSEFTSLPLRVQNHKFEEIRTLFWRNSYLNFNNPLSLIKSLEEKPQMDWLRKIHECEDEKALKYF
mgnify:CR=1 FL=1